MFDSIFDVIISLSLFVLIFIVFRLFYGIRTLNARVTILSSLVKKMRAEMGEENSDAFQNFEQEEQLLHNRLERDFGSQPSLRRKAHTSENSALHTGDPTQIAPGLADSLTESPNLPQRPQAKRKKRAGAAFAAKIPKRKP